MMKGKSLVGRGFVYWIPRIFSILFILFLAMFSLDVASPGMSLLDIMIGLFIHNIPVIILSILLAISWKYEIVGGITFIFAGILYIIFILIASFRNSFEWYYLSWSIIISGFAFLIGILFLIGWNRKKLKYRK